MRTGTLTFVGAICVVSASAFALCLLSANCPTAWTPARAAVPQPHFAEDGAPPCDWSADCSVAFALSATPSAPATFVCVTSPSSPWLPIRTDVFSFDGLICFASASASAYCLLSANCPTAWTPSPP